MALEIQIANLTRRTSNIQANKAQTESRNNLQERRRSFTPEEFAKYKKFIFTKPTDISKPIRFKSGGAPYTWCQKHNRMFRPGCDKINQ